MPTVEELTNPYVWTYVPPPHVGEGVCSVCHGATGTRADGGRYVRCESCERTRRQVTRPVSLVVPVSLYVVDGQLHTVLRGYKDSRDEIARGRFRLQVAALLARFLRDHSDCIRNAAGRTWDTLTIVPSGGGRVGVHPLERAVKMANAHRPLYRRLLERTDAPLNHREANEHAFRATAETAGRRVLLIDDTFTTGAAVQSAASALTLAGADVAAAVVIGRVVDLGYSDEARELWERQEGFLFNFGVCCLER